MSKAKNQETTVETKNTEVKVNLNEGGKSSLSFQ